MSELNIGEKLKIFRMQQKISLKELAAMAGITSSMLSQIERGQVNPSINTLTLLTKALKIPLYQLFMEAHPKTDLVVRRANRLSINFPNQQETSYSLLTPDTMGTIEFILMEVPPQTETLKVPQSHASEEVAYVLDGKIDILIDTQLYNLDVGDSIRIPARLAHKWINHTLQKVSVIFAVSPPTF